MEFELSKIFNEVIGAFSSNNRSNTNRPRRRVRATRSEDERRGRRWGRTEGGRWRRQRGRRRRLGSGGVCGGADRDGSGSGHVSARLSGGDGGRERSGARHVLEPAAPPRRHSHTDNHFTGKYHLGQRWLQSSQFYDEIRKLSVRLLKESRFPSSICVPILLTNVR